MEYSRRLLCHWQLILLSILSMLMIPNAAYSQMDEDVMSALDMAADSSALSGVEVSLVTCEPFNRVYSLYGHTGLRIHDSSRGIDMLANWGIFEMRKRYFILRFMFGLTDYKMEIESWQFFCERYMSYGSGVQEQVLNLNNDEKLKLIRSVAENYLPENRYYRYNYFYDNCTTRVRDIIVQSLDGRLHYNDGNSHKSYREMIHQWNTDHLWARWGNDFLLGVGSDRRTSRAEAQFLPRNLFNDFASATINGTDGTQRRLVSTTRWAVPPMYQQGVNSFSDTYLWSPVGVVLLYFIIYAVIYGYEHKKKKRLWQFDAFVLTATGLMGLVLTAMIFSQHPTVSLNFQILIFNPLSLIMLRSILRDLRQGQPSRRLYALGVMTALGIILGVTMQHYAEGVISLALLMLMTYSRSTGLRRQ